jgi:transposase
MDRRTVRDWVIRYNAEGLAFCLRPEQLTELSEVVQAGPDPAVDHVARWRRVDLRRLISLRWGVEFH